jgi:hypothetical protein
LAAQGPVRTPGAPTTNFGNRRNQPFGRPVREVQVEIDGGKLLRTLSNRCRCSRPTIADP